MSLRAISEDMLSVTSSQESEDGLARFRLRVSARLKRYGLGRAHASRSLPQENGRASKMNAISGPSGSISSASAALQLSLESRLLTARGLGSTSCSLTWKVKATPSGRLYCQLLASELPTSEIEHGLLPTPTGKANMLAPSMQKWPRYRNLLPTPSASSYGSNQGGAAGRTGPVRHSLESMARNSMWPTPASRDYRFPNKKSYTERGGGKKGEQLPNAVGGPLNPTWVAWLMGFPIEWLNCAPSGTRSSRKLRQSS